MGKLNCNETQPIRLQHKAEQKRHCGNKNKNSLSIVEILLSTTYTRPFRYVTKIVSLVLYNFPR